MENKKIAIDIEMNLESDETIEKLTQVRTLLKEIKELIESINQTPITLKIVK